MSARWRIAAVSCPTVIAFAAATSCSLFSNVDDLSGPLDASSVDAESNANADGSTSERVDVGADGSSEDVTLVSPMDSGGGDAVVIDAVPDTSPCVDLGETGCPSRACCSGLVCTQRGACIATCSKQPGGCSGSGLECCFGFVCQANDNYCCGGTGTACDSPTTCCSSLCSDAGACL